MKLPLLNRVKGLREKVHSWLSRLQLAWSVLESLSRPEPELTFNGSSIRFTVEGDVIVTAERHLITHYQLALSGCTRDEVAAYVVAYEQGIDAFDRFVQSVNALQVDWEEALAAAAEKGESLEQGCGGCSKGKKPSGKSGKSGVTEQIIFTDRTETTEALVRSLS